MSDPTVSGLPHPRRRRRTVTPRRRRPLAVALSMLILGASSMLTVAAAQAAPTPGAMAQIRMAHLSYGTGPADVYLTGFDGHQTLVLRALAYGQVSQYLQLAPGTYTAWIRPAGAAADSPAMLETSADLSGSTAYTVAVLGPQPHPVTKIVTDQLNAPPAGAGLVRVVQAASRAASVDVSAVGGPTIASDAPFQSVSDYAPVAAGTWTVEASGSGQTPVRRELTVAPGTVNSIIVYDAPGSSGIAVESVVDAQGTGGVVAGQSLPIGGAATGAGGTAPAPPAGVPGGLVVWAAALMATALAGFALLHGTTQRRRTARPLQS